jgi:hypothetical protein
MNVSKQNHFIAVSIERAERAAEILLQRGIAIASMEIGRYTHPVIRVHYGAACECLKDQGFSQTHNTRRGVALTRASLEQCLILWEEPLTTPIALIH